MPRKSACFNVAPEIKNTGLRPNWNYFWELDAAWRSESDTSEQLASSSSSFQARSLYRSSSGSESEGSIKQVRFVTGSLWIGVWDKPGMNGVGMYQLPNGVIYNGNMSGGVCEGVGMLKFPNGGMLDGTWHDGKLRLPEYMFSDKLMYSGTDWHYCKMPDRRFFLEQTDGLRPAPSEQLTADDRERVVPPDMYDVGDGLYSPKTKCVTDPHTGEVIRIPPATEEQWIMDHARTADTKTVGFCPQFYENLFGKVSTPEETATPSAVGEELVQELLRAVRQEGGELEPKAKNTTQDQMHQLHLKPIKGVSSSTSKSFEEMLFSNIIKNMELTKKPPANSSVNESLGKSAEEEQLLFGENELSFYRLLQDAGFKFPGRIEQRLLQEAASQSVESAESASKKCQSFSVTKSSLEVLRELKRLLNLSSSKSTMPFTILSSDFSSITTPLKMSETLDRLSAKGSSELTLVHAATDSSSNVFSEYMDSMENFNIDYLEFESPVTDS